MSLLSTKTIKKRSFCRIYNKSSLDNYTFATQKTKYIEKDFGIVFVIFQ
ncbi:hypothetical protein HMPREF0648_0166 [Prevotella bivia JCVIHMP010]|uniref:Uncharacterized protein n=1 Tax=Prevotella bivia TaxID=28125 RepID=A0A137T0B4_9BACT|nr:hypothetical protein HMPREF0648_0166 [Prevotella bivia JCVIHMP010]KXO18136.1 hypothetical protein HMPREF3202_00285 [Prevotella bivia]KXU60001.1 hypothetical protein HMPREF3218_0200156 [Prevotella bivia]